MVIKYQLLSDSRPASSSLSFLSRLHKWQICCCLFVLFALYVAIRSSYNIPGQQFYFGNNQVEKEINVPPKSYDRAEELEIQIEKLRNELTEKIWELEAIKNISRTAKTTTKRFRKRPETMHIDCGRLLKNDKAYMKEVGGVRRVKFKKSPLNMSCKAIYDRVLPPVIPRNISFGVAYARIVYKDYQFIEDEFKISYHPQNAFCFGIDRKANYDFHQRIAQLAKCFPNVYITPDDYDISGGGHNINKVHYDCIQTLVNNNTNWGYIMLLQNHDIITKSVYEMVEIFKILGGANDVELTKMPGDRIDSKFVWNAKNVQLFRDESTLPAEVLNRNFSWGKGATQVSLSREAAEWLVDKVDLSTLIAKIDKNGFGADEELWQMLQTSDFLGMPGHFTDECLKQNKNVDFISRMSQWKYGGPHLCASGVNRHVICLLGVEDIPTLAQFPNIMANKMMPDFDMGAIDCWHEVLFNRTYLEQDDHPLERHYYENMINVLYHKNKSNLNYKLNCTPEYVDWQKRKYPV